MGKLAVKGDVTVQYPGGSATVLNYRNRGENYIRGKTIFDTYGDSANFSNQICFNDKCYTPGQMKHVLTNAEGICMPKFINSMGINNYYDCLPKGKDACTGACEWKSK